MSNIAYKVYEGMSKWDTLTIGYNDGILDITIDNGSPHEGARMDLDPHNAYELVQFLKEYVR